MDIAGNLPDRWTGETHFELVTLDPMKTTRKAERRAAKPKADDGEDNEPSERPLIERTMRRERRGGTSR